MVNVLFFSKASVDIIVYDWFMNNKLKTLIMDAAITNKQHMGDQGWRSSESAHLRRHQCVPGFDSQTKSHMWVEFVVGSLLCSERFFLRYSGFTLSSNWPTLNKFQFQLGKVSAISARALNSINTLSWKSRFNAALILDEKHLFNQK